MSDDEPIPELRAMIDASRKASEDEARRMLARLKADAAELRAREPESPPPEDAD